MADLPYPVLWTMEGQKIPTAPLVFDRSSFASRCARLTKQATGFPWSSILYNPPMQKLPRAFYNRNTLQVARELLGKHLVHIANGIERVGRIVETEAYLGPHDLASHSARGLTDRNRPMFGPPGHAYVYFIYGMYYCMNVVTEREGHASAVLVRAIEPVLNIEDRTNGPGLLCRAMLIDKRLNSHDLLSDDFYITMPQRNERLVLVKRARVGVDYARHWAKRHLRFYLKGNPFVSRP